MAKKLTEEVVVIIHTPGEEKELIPFRVNLRPQQIKDFFEKEDYCGRVVTAFMTEACKPFDLDLYSCMAEILFPGIDYSDELPSDLLRVRPGMHTADLTAGKFLLH